MRTTDTGEFGDDFFEMFTRRPGRIEITTTDGHVLTGFSWELYHGHFTLDNLAARYVSIKSYTAEVDLGFPFGQYLTYPSSDPNWSDWEQHHRLEWFIARLRAEDIVKLVIGKGTFPDKMVTMVMGKIESLTVSHIYLVGNICLPRAEVGWVCQRKRA